MSEKMKSDKLAAAKKRLKQFQAQTQQTTPQPPPAATSTATASAEATDIAAPFEAASTPHAQINGANGHQPTPPQSTHSISPVATAVDAIHNNHQPPFAPADTLSFNPNNNQQLQQQQQQLHHNNELAALQVALRAANEATNLERQHTTSLTAEIQQFKAQLLQLQSDNARLNSRPAASTAPINDSSQQQQLQSQLQAHTDTIAILVDEKSNLAAGLAKFQSLAREKIAEVDELQQRLNASRHRVQALERDAETAKAAALNAHAQQQQLCSDIELAQEQVRVGAGRIGQLEDAVAELRQQLAHARVELEAERSGVEAVRRELGVAQLRVVQLSDGGAAGGGGGGGDEQQSSEAAQPGPVVSNEASQAAEQRCDELQQQLDRLQAERDLAGEQYQAYVAQLAADNARLAGQLHETEQQGAALRVREQQLVQHMGELERQMQQQQRLRSGAASQATSAESLATPAAAATTNESTNDRSAQIEAAEQMRAQIAELQRTSADQAAQLGGYAEQQRVYDELIARLEADREQALADRPDARRLLETMQGEKVTASRAVQQNVQLKQQLEELQRAFVQLSNDKLELTERLHSEQHLGRENRLHATERLDQVTALEQRLHFKDEEMIRLTHENSEHTKELLQLQQQIDRLRHYEPKVQAHAITIKRQQQQIEQLRLQRNAPPVVENQPTEATPASDSQETTTGATPVEAAAGDSGESASVLANGPAQPEDEPSAPAESATIDDPTADLTAADEPALLNLEPIATEEAMERLQERFTRTMTEIADLTEERNRLEHVCTQLQGETETIGEYIALYQSQRAQLRQREAEKDAQMVAVVHDREQMRQKLEQLNGLVERLIRTHEKEPTTSGGGGADGAEAATVAADVASNGDVADGAGAGKSAPSTAVEILTLLDELKDSNQNKRFYNQPLPDVHQCGCCYGKLETV